MKKSTFNSFELNYIDRYFLPVKKDSGNLQLNVMQYVSQYPYCFLDITGQPFYMPLSLIKFTDYARIGSSNLHVAHDISYTVANLEAFFLRHMDAHCGIPSIFSSKNTRKILKTILPEKEFFLFDTSRLRRNINRIRLAPFDVFLYLKKYYRLSSGTITSGLAYLNSENFAKRIHDIGFSSESDRRVICAQAYEQVGLAGDNYELHFPKVYNYAYVKESLLTFFSRKKHMSVESFKYYTDCIQFGKTHHFFEAEIPRITHFQSYLYRKYPGLDCKIDYKKLEKTTWTGLDDIFTNY